EHTDWSLLKFLKYRAEGDDFTYDRRKEHMLYKANLNLLARTKEHAQAIKYLSNFENEKASVSIDNFWMSVDNRFSNEKQKHIETGYDLTLADEVTQQMKTYIRSTTTRVTKRFLDSRETSSPKRSTRRKRDIEDGENETQMYQENQEIITDIGNNPLYVTEHIEKNE
ncbi:9495_t:CDS:2, partial [Paraglomus occultum]